MQFLAMFTMLIDHIGAVFFPDNAAWRIIGRVALPLYAYAVVIGYFRTRSVGRYLRRMGLLAVLSQLPYQLAFDTWEINVIANLFVCLLVLWLLDRLQGKLPLQLLLTAGGIVLLAVVPIDYGAYALLLVLIYRYTQRHWMVGLHFALNAAALGYQGIGWTLQLFSLFSTILIAYMPELLKEMDKIRIPRIIWRSFYPLHLAVIAAVSYALNGWNGG